MNIIVRKANINDIENGLLTLFIEGYRIHQNGRPDIFENLSDADLRLDLKLTLENKEVLVLLVNDNIVGYLSYIVKGLHSKKIHIEQLVIAKNYQKQGLGKRLIEEVRLLANNLNCKRIELNCWLFNENAQAMYEHIGFQKQRIVYEMPISNIKIGD